MLSRPPGRVRGVDEPACRAYSSEPRSSNSGASSFRLVDHRGRPSEQSRKRSPALTGKMSDVDLHVGLGPERAGDHRALRVLLGLLLGQLAARHQLADQRVVLRQPDQVAVAQQVGARVADVGD